ncbi:MAG: hypothetical protein A3I02_04645 [Betaproteobacteria bacterium RIFCSPLOWO2_02_FULL_67_26]|nr:MAG: hypothetical protein A3I02_04645 [Betaproteobacteria bacterium RIFCSPLOWO2_02_FULL_67_26]
MKIEAHLERAAAFERAVARLDPLEDGELYVVFLMRAGTNRVNAALHALGLTSEAVGGAAGKIGDLNHTYKPKLEVALPPALREAFQHLALLEDLRPEFVRGPGTLDRAMVEACSRAYAGIRACTDSLVGQGTAA